MNRLALVLLLLVPIWAAETVKEHSVVVDASDATYTIDVAGTMDPENIAIELENLGDAPVVSPRVTVNGKFDWYDVKSIADEVTRGLATDEEKAMALFQWVLYKRYQRSPHDRSALHPVRAMNGYGYGICGHTSAWMKALWTAAGLRARVQELWGHTVSEVFYDGAWHMLDANVKVFYLNRDNRTIASLAELEKDRTLIERTIHSHDPWVRQPDTREHNEELVQYLVTAKDNFEEHAYDGEIEKNHTMAMSLKPGEKLVRWWKPVLGKFEGRDKRPEVPSTYANGQLIWEPDLKRVDLKGYIHAMDNVATRGEGGRGLPVHIADLQDERHTRPSRFTIPIHSSYPIIGGRLWCTLVKEGNSSLDQAAIFYGEPGWGGGNLYTFQWGKGSRDVEFDLDPNIMRSGVVYNYTIGFNLRGNAKSDPPSQAGLERVRVVTDLQVSPHSLPALSLGKNLVQFRDESAAGRRVRITHRWREVYDRRPPAAITVASTPRDGGEVQALAPVLKWNAPTNNASGEIVDYQVMVSLRPDCRWPLSPTLHQNTGTAKTEWTVPQTFLNPGTTYYWKVRARNVHGDVGPWGSVFHFRTAAAAK